MALVSHIDGTTRDIFLSVDTVGNIINPIDIYKEVRTLRRTNEPLRQFFPFMQARGNDFKGAGKYTERYVVLLQGTRIVPYNVSHTLTVVGTVITDDGQEGISCFDRSPLSTTTRVDINYQPPQVEIITVATGGALTAIQEQQLFQATQQAANVWTQPERTLTTAVAGATSQEIATAVWEKDVRTLTTEVGGGLTVEQADKLNYIAGATQDILIPETIKSRKMQTNNVTVFNDGKYIEIYDDDGLTVLHRFNVSDDRLSRIAI